MKLEYNKGILFIRLKGNLNHVLSKEINTCLIPKVLEQKIKYIVINLYEVEDVDTFGLDAILNLKCAVRSLKGKICICELSNELNNKIKKYKIKEVKNELQALNTIGAI